jgi:hypothetical protein
MRGQATPEGPSPGGCSASGRRHEPLGHHAARSQFELSLRAANKSPKTIKSYTDTVRGVCMFLADKGMPTDLRNLTREPVETYISVQVEQYRPKTASIRFGDL